MFTDERIKVVRVRNSISVLHKMSLSISPDSITAVYLASEKIEMNPKVRISTYHVFAVIWLNLIYIT